MTYAFKNLDTTEHDGDVGDFEESKEDHTVTILSEGNHRPPDCHRTNNPTAAVEPEIGESSSFSQRLHIIFESATPIICTFFLSLSGSFVNLIFCGHLSSLAPLSSYHDAATTAQIFAGISLANMYANVTYRSIIIGLTGGIETLGSQHNGAGNYREVGLTLWRSILILSVVALPCFAMWQYSDSFFRLMHIDPVVCEIIAVYLKVCQARVNFGMPVEGRIYRNDKS